MCDTNPAALLRAQNTYVRVCVVPSHTFTTKILRSDIFSQGEPQRSSNAPKFEDRSQEETEWQEQGAREAAWKLAKNVFKLKEQERAAFFSPSEIGASLHQR